MKSSIKSLIHDPNQHEVAEACIYVTKKSGLVYDPIRAESFSSEITILYNNEISYTLIKKIINELEKTDRALVYVGPTTKCVTWAKIFSVIGFESTMQVI
jgi:hypothetical protein